MARKSGFSLASLAGTSVGRMNADKIAKILSAKAGSKAAAGKSNKYGAVQVIFDDIKFHSKGEGLRYMQLKAYEKQGRISGLRLQVRYELTPAMKKESGEHVRASSYTADFVYFNVGQGREVVEDFKGKRTQHYADKAKQMLTHHGIEIYETNREHTKRGIL